MKSKRLVMGILAHVDAGKTTLSESILYVSGSIRKLGRVDHGNAFLDTDQLERARGITIFSKEARFTLGDKEITLLDTPGHVDFSAEMERTLQVLDCAVLVINGADGVQNHTMTLWKLLNRYGIPVFLFVNKMDQAGTERRELLKELRKRLGEGCVDFSERPEAVFLENLALCREDLMEEYLERGEIAPEHIRRAISERWVFPCFFGSALKMEGVEEFLQGLGLYSETPDYIEEFGAKIYKISRDAKGNRLTHMKITGGVLKVKTVLTKVGNNAGGKEKDATIGDWEVGDGKKGIRTGEMEVWEEKVDQIRLYSGSQFESISQAEAGMVCAVTGLKKTWAGEGLGVETASDRPVLEPVLTYQVVLPPSCDVHGMLLFLRRLEEEEPQLHIVWKEELNEIHAQIMGEIEIEILKSLILDRYGVEVEFGSCSILYKETISKPVVGVGHFEPLRHYAEVHLLLEPGERGSGLHFDSCCSEDVLDKSWQRLILSHLRERAHKGVLTGSQITDMKITLAAGRGHEKHTEGGDFRQAAYRALRQGLKKAGSILLEPVYEFHLETPVETVGRVLSELQRMNAAFSLSERERDMSVIAGSAPASAMKKFQQEMISCTRGLGRLFFTLKGYEPCRNEKEVVDAIGYDSEKDLENPTGSVFCSRGAGFVVSWEDVDQYKHVDSGIRFEKENGEKNSACGTYLSSHSPGYASEKELEEIFLRTYGGGRGGNQDEKKGNNKGFRKRINQEAIQESHRLCRRTADQKSKERYLLVDGYNIIFAWDELKALAEVSIDGARDKLIEILSNFHGNQDGTLILVFDAYKVEGGRGSVLKYDNIDVIYTKEAETADQYIERAVNKIGRIYDVTVATSDSLVQMISWGEGARRLSARELLDEIEARNTEIRNSYLKHNESTHHFPFENLERELSGRGEAEAAPIRGPRLPGDRTGLSEDRPYTAGDRPGSSSEEQNG